MPYDLGVRYTVDRLPAGCRCASRVRPAGGAVSGAPRQRADRVLPPARPAPRRPRQAACRAGPAGRRVRSRSAARAPPELGGWAVPLPTLDPAIVARSAAALDRYGPDFAYRHYALVERLPRAVGGVAGAGRSSRSPNCPPPARRCRGGSPRRRPDPARRARGWFRVRFVGEGGGRRIVTEVAGGDPGYEESAKMLAESALSLALDELPPAAGQVTTAVAMGEALTDRLTRAGLTFRVVSRTDPGRASATSVSASGGRAGPPAWSA
ncbi:hypothetical protein NKH77_42165 [Streptomyces sp. M19]